MAVPAPTTPAVPMVPESRLLAAQERLSKANAALTLAGRQADPGGVEGTLLAAAGGVLDGLLSECVVGSVMGMDITLAPMAPLLDIGIHLATNGQLPGGIAGSTCRVIRAASHSQTSGAAKAATKAAVGFARTVLLAPRAADRQAPHPPSGPTVVVEPVPSAA